VVFAVFEIFGWVVFDLIHFNNHQPSLDCKTWRQGKGLLPTICRLG